MDLARKLEVAAQAVKSISRHEDEDAAVRQAVLDQLEGTVRAERTWIASRIASRIAQTVPAAPQK